MNRTHITAVTLSLTSLIAISSHAAFAQISALSPAPLTLTVSRALVARFDADEEFDKGVELQNKMQYKEAVAAYTRAIQLRPKFTDAFFNRGSCYQTIGDFEKSVADFTVVVTNKPKMADGWLYRGIGYSQLKQYDKAMADYNQALTLRPGFVDVQTYLAEASFNKGDFDGAIKSYSAYLSSAPKPEPTVYVNLGRAKMEKYKQTKDATLVTQALSDFDKYIAAPPTRAGESHASGYLDRGDANMLLKAYDKAIADYTQYLAKTPKDTYALGRRGEAYLETKKFKEAGADYDAILAIKPNDPAATQNKAVVALRLGDNSGAAAAFSKVISNPPKPDQKGALEARAQAYMNAKDYPNAIKDYDYLIGFDKTNSNAYYNRAVALASTGSYDKAAGDFNAYLASNPKDSAPAYNGLGLAYANTKQYDKAADAFTKYITANPKDGQAIYNRGAAYYNTKKFKEAIKDMDAVIALKPSDQLVAQANKLKGEAAVNLSPEEGLAALKAAADADPKNGDVQLNYGVALQKLGRNDEAITQFTKAIAVNPKDTQALMNRVVAYQAKKDWANVIKDSTAALAIKSDLSDAVIARADANLQLKAYPAAVTDYKQYLTLKPKDAYALSNLGAAAFQSKDYATASQAFTDYISVADPKEKSKALQSRGVIYFQQEKYDEAIKDMTDYLATSPGDAQALLTRGAAYAKKKDFEKAAADFEASYTAKPDFDTATQGALSYTSFGDQFKDSNSEKAAGLYDKAAMMYDKAITAGNANVGKPGGPTAKAIADTYYNKGLVYQKKSKAKDNDVEPLKSAVEAFKEYVRRGSALTPPASDIAGVKDLITQLETKIANG
jgi:tetratricopeptide (TPR) repeat protein